MVKNFWRTARTWICHNHKIYYTYVLCLSLGLYQFWWYSIVGYYRRRNFERSLEFAIMQEKEWEKIKPAEDDDDDDEEYGDEDGAAEEGAEAGEEAAAEDDE
jgi:hypothetical protein